MWRVPAVVVSVNAGGLEQVPGLRRPSGIRMRQVARRRLERRISLQRKIPHRPATLMMPGIT